ncbi:MAG TPA: hypothetical protein VGD67_16620 [Pseudonocardiaceae bacterium]
MSTLAPRAVLVTRRTELEELLDRHGTRGAAEFYLRSRGRDLEQVQRSHDAQAAAVAEVGAALPPDWRRGHVERADLARFPFAPEDTVVVVGRDGLVANVAKYVRGQRVVGVDPEPGRNPGVLVPHRAADVAALLTGPSAAVGLTMVRAVADDGQELVALNEIYLGDRGHQSARYLITTPDGRRERQSSSGLIVATGTGATGWCASVAGERASAPPLPDRAEAALAWFVREAWPSPSTGVTLTAGRVDGSAELTVVCQSERTVLFGDGVEDDRVPLSWGQQVTVGVADRRLHLVQATGVDPPAALRRSI